MQLVQLEQLEQLPQSTQQLQSATFGFTGHKSGEEPKTSVMNIRECATLVFAALEGAPMVKAEDTGVGTVSGDDVSLPRTIGTLTKETKNTIPAKQEPDSPRNLLIAVLPRYIT